MHSEDCLFENIQSCMLVEENTKLEKCVNFQYFKIERHNLQLIIIIISVVSGSALSFGLYSRLHKLHILQSFSEPKVTITVNVTVMISVEVTVMVTIIVMIMFMVMVTVVGYGHVHGDVYGCGHEHSICNFLAEIKIASSKEMTSKNNPCNAFDII